MKPPALRRLVLLAVMAGMSVTALVVGAVPLSDWFDQRSTTDELLAELAKVEAVNDEYRVRIDALNTDYEIERRARADYNLVRPNEEAYAVLPPPTEQLIRGIWPFAN